MTDMIEMTVSIKMTVNNRPKTIYTEQISVSKTADFNKVNEIIGTVYDYFRDRNQHLRTVEMQAEANIQIR